MNAIDNFVWTPLHHASHSGEVSDTIVSIPRLPDSTPWPHPSPDMYPLAPPSDLIPSPPGSPFQLPRHVPPCPTLRPHTLSPRLTLPAPQTCTPLPHPQTSYPLPQAHPSSSPDMYLLATLRPHTLSPRLTLPAPQKCTPLPYPQTSSPSPRLTLPAPQTCTLSPPLLSLAFIHAAIEGHSYGGYVKSCCSLINSCSLLVIPMAPIYLHLYYVICYIYLLRDTPSPNSSLGNYGNSNMN